MSTLVEAAVTLSAVEDRFTAVSADGVERTGCGGGAGANWTPDVSSPVTADVVLTTAACPDAESELVTVGASTNGADTPGPELGPNRLDEVVVDNGCPNKNPPDVDTCVGTEADGTAEGFANSAVPDWVGVVVEMALVVPDE